MRHVGIEYTSCSGVFNTLASSSFIARNGWWRTSTGVGRLSGSTSNTFWTRSKNWDLSAFLMLLKQRNGPGVFITVVFVSHSYQSAVFSVQRGTLLGTELTMLGV